MSEFPALDDFDDFSAPAGGAGAQGDFLARERELLGDEFGPTPTDIPSTTDFEDKPRTSFPSLDGGDSDDILKGPPTAAGHTSRPSTDFMSTFERDQPAAAPALTSNSVSAKVEDDDDDEHDDSMLHADINKFQTQYPDLQIYPPVDQQQQQQSQHQNGYADAPLQPAAQQSYSSTPAPTEPESDAVRAWREKQAEEIAKRDEDSNKRKEDIIAKAERAIDDFYSTYNQKKEKQISQNKEDEAVFIQARDDTLAKGTTWERIADLIELQDSRSKTVARGTKDLSRMKEVLLSLKREGDTAPNAAGY